MVYTPVFDEMAQQYCEEHLDEAQLRERLALAGFHDSGLQLWAADVVRELASVAGDIIAE